MHGRISLALCVVLGIAPSVPAQTPDDGIRKVCEPLVVAFVAESRTLVQGKESWRWYASRLYFSDARTIEEARSQGFSVEVIYEGVPLSAIWSDDKTRRETARTVWRKAVDEQEAKKEFTKLDEVKNDPQAVAEYNKCVTQMALSTADMSCWFSEPRDRARATLHVVLRPKMQMSPQRVEEAPVVNGFVVPADLEALKRSRPATAIAIESAIEVVDQGGRIQLPPGVRTSLPFAHRINAGVFAFELVRLDPERPMRSFVRLANNLSCQVAEAPPVPTVVVSVTLWPEARDWEVVGQTFQYYVRVGCGKGVGDHTQDFCLADPSTVVRSAKVVKVTTENCGCSFGKIEIGKPNPQCVRVHGSLRGCGWGPVGDCKGRGWLGGNVEVSGDLPKGSRSVQRFSKTDVRHDLLISKEYAYDIPLPPDIRIERWRYSVEVQEAHRGPVRTFTLSDQSPSGAGCKSSVSRPTDRSGVVRLECEATQVENLTTAGRLLLRP